MAACPGRLVRQLSYVIDLVGPEHVALGLDYVFDPSEIEEALRRNPELFAAGTQTGATRATAPPESIAEIVEALARTNMSDAQIRGILGRTGCASLHRCGDEQAKFFAAPQ